jgi:hypothetical protein
MKYLYNIALLAVVCLCGFILGRCTKIDTVKTEYKYIKGKTIIDSIKVPTLVTEYIPSDPIYIKKIITKDSFIVQVVDTAKILEDWTKRRVYCDVVMDNDTTGRLEIESTIQYNKLQQLKYKLDPVTKVITNTVVYKKNLELLGGAGMTFNGSITGQVGILRNHLGVTYQYTRDYKINKSYHGINVMFRY